MESKDRITTEDLRKKFKNQFDLVNYAIKLAENMILTGRAARVEIDAESRALQILEEISAGKDMFDEVPALVERQFDDRHTEHHNVSVARQQAAASRQKTDLHNKSAPKKLQKPRKSFT